MIKTETKMIPQEEQVYYCDSCGNKLGTYGKLEDGQELTTIKTFHNERGFTCAELKTSYHLCYLCFSALDRHLTKQSEDKKGLKDILK